MVVAEPAPASSEDVAEVALGLGEILGPAAFDQEHREVVATLQGVEMVLAEELAAQRQAAALQSFGLVGLGRLVALDEHDRQVVDALGDVGVNRRIERLAQGERLAEETLGRREVALLLEDRGEGVGALGDVGPPVSGQRAAEGESLFGEGASAVEAPEIAVQPGEAREQRRPELGPEGELAPDSDLAAFEELSQGRRVAQLLVAGERIGAEQVDQKGRQLARLVALGSRGVALAGDDGGLAHGKDGERGEQESDHGRGADADAVPAGELAQAVGRALGPGADRPAGAEPGDVFGEPFDGRVAALGRLAQRGRDNGVEVAPQRAGERRRARPPRRRRSLVAGGRHRLARLARVDGAHRALEPGQRSLVIAERPPAGEQLEEQQAEGIDVGRGGDRLAGELLGAGIFGRREAQRRARLPQPLGAGRFRVEELGDAEVEQPYLAALGQQDVGRLEIAMDDEVNMGVVHRLADLLEQGQPLAEAESPLVGGDGERPAVDVFERQVGDAGGVDAAVEELRDAAMGEAGQGLALDPEAPAELAALEPPTDPLQRDLAAEPGLVTFGQPDFAHAALAEQPLEPVGTDPLRSGRGVFRHPLLERQRPAPAVRLKHPLELAEELEAELGGEPGIGEANLGAPPEGSRRARRRARKGASTAPDS